MIAADRKIKGACVVLLGLTFKENCEDLRNSRVIDVIRELESYGVEVVVHDPVANVANAKEIYGIELSDLKGVEKVDAIIAAVAHDALLERSPSAWAALLDVEQGTPFMDVKSAFDRHELAAAGFKVWRL